MSFGYITESGQRLMGLLNNLLDLAKLEAGKMVLNNKQIDLVALFSDCCKEQEQRMKDLGLNLQIEPREEVVMADCDGEKVAQVLTNILSNAIKFSPKNGTISAGITQNDEQLLIFSLHDEGLGIAENELDKIFDAFVQSSEIKQNTGGTGLGLAMSKEIVEFHGGNIWAESAPNEGVTLVLALPTQGNKRA